MTLRHIYSRFRQFGGMRLLWEYHKAGVSGTLCSEGLKCIMHGKSVRSVYAAISTKVDKLLKERYCPIIPMRAETYSSMNLEHIASRRIWFCWLQGMDEAPELVKACLVSVKRMFPEYEVTVITNKNWTQYVTVRDYAVEKWDKGVIPPALFADILRLELLIKYGGTWIDATVLCTGMGEDGRHRKHVERAMSADLFMFQYRQPGSPKFSGTGNWFISAKTNNVMLMVLRDILYEYWRDYDCLIEYYIFHLFFSVLAEHFQEEMKRMPLAYARPCLQLGYRLADDYDGEWWSRLTGNVCFHKMNYRMSDKAAANPDSYYNRIITEWNMTRG